MGKKQQAAAGPQASGEYIGRGMGRPSGLEWGRVATEIAWATLFLTLLLKASGS